MFITNLLRDLRNHVGRQIRSRGRPGRCHRVRDASRGYSRTLAVEPLEDRLLLTSYIVDTPLDDPSTGQFDTDGLISLREAITAANTNLPFGDAPAGQDGDIVDTITFDPELGGEIIELGGSALSISDDLDIIGLSADELTVSGSHASRVFLIDVGVSVSISHLTIADGAGGTGGGIYNVGALAIADSRFLNNSTTGHGGGIARIGAFEVQPLSAEIDVKPGSDRNSINLASNGVIAVAILTTDSFDASLVDVTTVEFAGAHAVHSAFEDTDGDGDLDLILHFRTQETKLLDLYAELVADDINADDVLDSRRQTAAVSLTGRTATDEYFQAFDEVDLFLSGKSRGRCRRQAFSPRPRRLGMKTLEHRLVLSTFWVTSAAVKRPEAS